MRRFIHSTPIALTIATALAPVAPAHAQNYPARPIRWIVPVPAGATTDIVTRLVAQKMGEAWKQQVVVDNRAGGAMIIGTDTVAKATPDGYTIGTLLTPTIVNPFVLKNLPYDTLKDLTPVSLMVMVPGVMTMFPGVPANNLKEVIALAKSKPGALNYGSPGPLTSGHLSMEMLKITAGINMTHIPYKGGSGQMVSDLLAGQVQLESMGLPPAMPYVKSGRLRVIGVTSLKRSPLLPEAPTVAESGLPGYEVNSWYGMFAPPAVSKEIIAKINADIVALLGGTDIKERLASLGAEPQPMTPDEFGRFVREDIAKWAKVVKESGAKID